MIGLYGHASAKEHICFLRLCEEYGDAVRFYQTGENPIIAADPRTLSVGQQDPHRVARQAIEDGVELFLVTDTLFLQGGAVDICRAEGIRVLGPSHHAAEIEDHKSLMKRLVLDADVPAPENWVLHTAEDAKALLREHWSEGHRYVVKADALIPDAAHRSMVPETLEEAEHDVDLALAALAKFGRSEGILIERRIAGFETSVHVLWDGDSYVLFPPVRDYKRVGDGDTGPMTYGAASIACGRGFAPELEQQLRERIIEPTLGALAQNGYGYHGFVYFGVMLLDDGPELLEINVRPGDPEFVALLGLLKSSFRDLIDYAANGKLHQANVTWHKDLFSGAVFAMGAGYPDTMTPEPVPITGAANAVSAGNAVVEDIGCDSEGQHIVTGGRVIAPIATGPSIEAVRDRIHETLAQVHFEGMHHRTDLGYGLDPRLFAKPDDQPNSG